MGPIDISDNRKILSNKSRYNNKQPDNHPTSGPFGPASAATVQFKPVKFTKKYSKQAAQRAKIFPTAHSSADS